MLWKRKIDKKMKSHGDIDYEKQLIRVNPVKGDLIDTIYHEELHKKYPDKPEKWIRKESRRMARKATKDQVIKMIKKYK
ncbi:MAG: hypothetical protein WCW29_04350 [Candidatus Paceibacterota bacterium]